MGIKDIKENISKVKNWVGTFNKTQYADVPIEPTYFPTPNPNALKFVLNVMLSYNGKNTYRSLDDCKDNFLAQGLLNLRESLAIENVHFFQNTITITKQASVSWDELIPEIEQYLIAQVPYHNPDFSEVDPEQARRKSLSPELLEIEEILDKTIRGGLQADGGDLKCIDFKDDVLLIKYLGACGSCPSSSTGTLEAIKHILKDELGREIDVYIVPE